MFKRLFVLAAALAVLLAACGGSWQDCVTTDGGNQLCLSVNPEGKTATPAPADTPAPTDGKIVCTDGMAMAQIKPGETIEVEAGCRISGDVVVDGVTLFDNAADTGLLVDVRKPAQVFAEWGASVNADSVDEWNANMKASGCAGQCKTVIVVTWPK